MSGAAALAQDAHHLDAVHVRHPHVGDDEVGAVALGGGQTLLAVGGFADHGAAERGPVDAEHDAAAHHGLVVNDQYLEHGPLLSELDEALVAVGHAVDDGVFHQRL